MFKDITRAHVLSFISIILSLAVMLFGNNFSEKWKKAELYYTINEVKVEYPQEIISKLPLHLRDSIYNYYQQIQIMNLNSKSATKLNLIINPNAVVKKFQAYSIEDTIATKVESGLIKIKVEDFQKLTVR